MERVAGATSSSKPASIEVAPLDTKSLEGDHNVDSAPSEKVVLCPSIEALARTVECSNVCSALSIVSPTDLLTLGFSEDCGTVTEVEIEGTALGVTSAKTVDESKVGFVGEEDDGLKNSSVIDVNIKDSLEEADGTTEEIPDVRGVVCIRMLLVVVEGTTIDDSTASDDDVGLR